MCMCINDELKNCFQTYNHEEIMKKTNGWGPVPVYQYHGLIYMPYKYALHIN